MATWFQKTVARARETVALRQYQRDITDQEQHFPKLEAMIKKDYDELQQTFKEIEIMSSQVKGDPSLYVTLQELKLELSSVSENMSHYMQVANEKKEEGRVLATSHLKTSTLSQKLEAYVERKEHNVDITQTLVKARIPILDMQEKLQPLHSKLRQQLENPSQNQSQRQEPQVNKASQTQDQHQEIDNRFNLHSQEKSGNIYDKVISYDPHAPVKDHDLDHAYANRR